jgi:hypothetical protein
VEEIMGELDADIGEFELYTKIVAGNDISDTRWAKAARIPQPRIAELHGIVRLMKEEGLTQEEASKRMKRDCTHVKLDKLYRGLCNLLGEEYMAKSIESAIKHERNPRRRLQYRLRALPAKLLPQVDAYLRELHTEGEQETEGRSKKK